MDQHDQLLTLSASGRTQALVLALALALLGARAGAAQAIPPAASPLVTTVRPQGGGYIAEDPDGSTVAREGDPSAAINAAIARVSAEGGGAVMIEAGTYDLHAPVELRTGVRLVGAGGLLSDDTPRSDYPTTLRAAGSGMPALVEAINADGARLEHLTLDGRGKVADVVKTASYALRMRDCAVRGGTRRCVWVTQGKPLGHDMYVQATFINCLFDQEGRGVGVEGSHAPPRNASRRGPGDPHRGAFTDGVIYRCRFLHVGEMAAAICGGWQFLDNEVRGEARRGGVGVFGGATTVTDNDIETTAGPPIAVELGNVAITGNRLRRRDPGDVIVVGAGLQAVAISGNRWAAAGGGYFADFEGPEIERDCAVFGNRGQGAPVSNLGPSVGLYLEGNAAENAEGWRPVGLLRRPAPPPIRAVVSLAGGAALARDAAGRTIAADADASKAINAAIRAVAGGAPAAVFVARGTYRCASPIVLLPGVILVGEGGMSRVPVGFEAMGTVLKAASGATAAVVDLTDAPGAGLDEMAVDGSLIAEKCVVLAARSAWIDNCFVERARREAIDVTNGNDPAPGAYAGMLVADTLVHAGLQATGLAVQSDPAARGELPRDGTVVDARLRLGFIQAAFAHASGWKVVGNHGTSNGHSIVGFVLDGDRMYVAGNYFDTVNGPRLRIGGSRIELLGNHFQATPTGQFPTAVIETAAGGISIEASTWHPPARPHQSRRSFFASLSGAPAGTVTIVGNVGEGRGQILNAPAGTPDVRCAGNFVAPPIGGWRLDAGR